MSQYVLQMPDTVQARALLNYLQTLDFVDLMPLDANEKAASVAAAKALLDGLPHQRSSQQAVNQAVASVRKKHGYR